MTTTYNYLHFLGYNFENINLTLAIMAYENNLTINRNFVHSHLHK